MLTDVRASACLIALGAAVLGGCGGHVATSGESLALLDDGEDLASVESASEDVGASLVGGDETSVAISPDQARFPTPCITVDKLSASSEIVHLRGCGAPAARGDVTVRWELRGLVLHVELASTDLTVGATHFSAANVTAEVVGSGLDRTGFWDAHFEGQARVLSPNPRAFVRDVSKTVRWRVGGACATTDGASSGSFETKDGGRRNLRAVVSAYRTCGLPCPEPNSRVRVEDTDTQQSVQVRFLAQGHALFTDVQGRELPIVPACAKR